MPIALNYDGKLTIPRILSSKYKHTVIQAEYALILDETKKVTINPKSQVADAWKYIEDNCAKSKKCNDYFKSLPGGKDLKQWMTGTNFVVNLLTPITNARTGITYTEADLPEANTAGNAIGISLGSFILMKDKTEEFAALLLHEIAHTAGASSDSGDAKHSLDAENALIPCGLQHYWREDAKG